jgi:hypothetical protein
MNHYKVINTVQFLIEQDENELMEEIKLETKNLREEFPEIKDASFELLKFTRLTGWVEVGKG